MQAARTLAERCRRSFPKITWDVGEDYYRRRRVSIFDIGEKGLEAHVVGNGKLHEVALDWWEAKDGVVEAYCTCPRGADGFLCKHVAAVIIAADHEPRMPAVPGDDRLNVLPTSDTTETGITPDDDAWEMGWPDRSGSVQGRSGRRRHTTTWRRAIRDLALPPKSSPQLPYTDAGAGKRQLFYRISLVHHQADGRLTIEFVKRTIKRDGTLGMPSAWSLESRDVDHMPDPADREVLALLLGSKPQDDYGGYRSYYYRPSQKSSCCELSPATYGILLPKLAATGRLGWSPGRDRSEEELHLLYWDEGPPWKFKLALSAPQEQATRKLLPKLYREGEEGDLAQVVMAVTGCIVFNDRLARLDISVRPETISVARRLPEVEVPAGQVDQFVEEIWKTDLPQIELPEDLHWQTVSVEPQPRVVIAPVKMGAMTFLIGKVSFDYGGVVVNSEDNRRTLCDRNERRLVHRDENRELDAQRQIYNLGGAPTAYGERAHGTFKVARQHFAAMVLALNDAGWHVEAEGHRIRRPGSTQISLASGIDWFELDGHVDYDGEQVGLPKLLEALRRGENYVTLDDGSRGMLPVDWLARYAPLAQMGEAEGELVRFKPSQAWLLDAWLAAQPEVNVDAAFEQVRQRLRSFEGIRQREEPTGFSGVLRPYQRDGLGWLLFLEDFGFGGCLADDMGLGKTIQVLAMLIERRNRMNGDGARRPSLVVVPRSLVRNWVEEAKKFTPELRVLDYTGLARCQTRQQFDQYDLVVTTYGTLRRDAGHLKELPFEYAILDEAQAIKNAQSQAAKACRLIQAQHRLAMTGTPVENHLGELWSIFEFLNPGMLGRSNSLRVLSSKSSGGNAETVRLLAKALRPFVLRRTKEQVLSDLPEKTEQTLYCELDAPQRKLYDELRKHYRDSLNQRIASEGMAKAKIHVLEALLRLRQAACHPGLIDKSKDNEPSAKLETLLEQLQEVLDEGHKALVFSQFTSLLALVRKRLDKGKIVYEYLDGQTRDRQKRVDRFQTDPACPLFLISLKAGGLGLNLTAADYVFILDPWWNPAVEAQAVDRAHRIGQTRRVFAYRLIARDTVEEKILQLQGDKRQLAEAIISADNSLIVNLTAEDLQLLLS
jgi:superfamily II DNA or RNA helicase